ACARARRRRRACASTWPSSSTSAACPRAAPGVGRGAATTRPLPRSRRSTTSWRRPTAGATTARAARPPPRPAAPPASGRRGRRVLAAQLVEGRRLPGGGGRRWGGGRNAPPPAAPPPLDDVLAAVECWLDSGEGGALAFEARVTNGQRTLGARAAGLIARRFGDAGLPGTPIRATFTGAAGQSFGSFALPGMRLELRGEAQDYVGKSLAGGELVLRPRDPNERGVIAGNTVLYGA